MKAKILFVLLIFFYSSAYSLSPGNTRNSHLIEQNIIESKYLFLEDTTKYFGWRADNEAVGRVAYNKDGTILASSGADKNIKFWDPKTGTLLKTLSGHTDIINSISFSPDGSKLVSASNDHSVKLWDVYTGKEITTFTGNTREVFTAVFSPDGRYIVSGSGWPYNLKVWDALTYSLIKTYTLDYSNFVACISFSPDGKFIATGTSKNEIIIWDMSGDTTIFKETMLTYSVLHCLCYTSDGKKIITGGGSMKIWNLIDHSLVKDTDIGTLDIIYSKEKNVYISANMERNNTYSIKIWRPDNFTLLKGINLYDLFPGSISISPDGNNLACGVLADKSLPNLRIYNISSLLSAGKLSITSEYQLFQNYPNPFNPSTVISFQLSGNNNITLKIYDILGREVQILINEQKPAGKHNIIFDAKNLPGGVYYYTLVGREFSTTKSMLLLK